MPRYQLLFALAFAGLGASCGGKQCTLIACTNAVYVQLSASAVQHFTEGQPIQVKACVGVQCVTETLTATGGTSTSTGSTLSLMGGKLTFETSGTFTSAQTVSLELTKAGNVVFTDSRDGVAFQHSYPNGPDCGGDCQTANVNL